MVDSTTIEVPFTFTPDVVFVIGVVVTECFDTFEIVETVEIIVVGETLFSLLDVDFIIGFVVTKPFDDR